MSAERGGPGARLAATAFLATAALAGFLLLRRPEVEIALHLYLVAMGTLAAAALLTRALAEIAVGERPSLLDRLRSRRRPPGPERTRSLEELEHAVDFAGTTAFDVHYRLRPHLVRIARHRLAAKHGILLEADPEAARARLGEAAWELVRPDREPPAERNARGLGPARLRAVVEALEAL